MDRQWGEPTCLPPAMGPVRHWHIYRGIPSLRWYRYTIDFYWTVCMLDGIDALRKLDIVFSVDNMTVCCNSLRPVIIGMRITAEAQVKSIPKLSSFYNKQEWHLLRLSQMAWYFHRAFNSMYLNPWQPYLPRSMFTAYKDKSGLGLQYMIRAVLYTPPPSPSGLCSDTGLS